MCHYIQIYSYDITITIFTTNTHPRLPDPAPHRHGRDCMIPARQAAAWCPGLVLRPEPETLHRKRGLESGPSSAEEGEEGWGEEQTLLSESIQNRKRPRVTEVGLYFCEVS